MSIIYVMYAIDVYNTYKVFNRCLQFEECTTDGFNLNVYNRWL